LARLARHEVVANIVAPLTPLKIERWPRRAWSPPATLTTLADAVGSAWNQSECWLVTHAAGHHLSWLRADELWDAALDDDAARIGRAVADATFTPRPEAAEVAEVEDRALRRLAALLLA
jgi:hypothetical protein